MKNVAKEIKKRMVDLEMTAKQFAKKCDINENVFSNLMNGKRPFSYRHMVRIMEYVPTLTVKDFEESNKAVISGQ